MISKRRPPWAVRLQTEREARGWNKREMARRLLRAAGYEHGSIDSLARQIRDWEAGRHFPRDWSATYATAFEITEDELFGADTTTRAIGPFKRPSPGHALPHPSDRPDYAAAVRDTNVHLIALDSRYGGTGIADIAVQAFTTARTALATGRHDADETDLQSAVGETGEIAAWCLYDGDRLEESRSVIHEAMLVSRLAGDRAMELFQLSHLALVNIHQRHSREALRIAENVIDPGSIAPRVEALFKIRAARALAQSGDRARAVAALDRASGALLDSVHPRDPHWTWWLNDAELAVQRGLLHLELGDHSTAMPYFDEAAHGRLRRDPYNPVTNGGAVNAHGELWGRAAYNDLVHLLLALTMARAWADAEPVAEAVSDFTREVISARTEVMLTRAVNNIARATSVGTPDRPSTTLIDLTETIAAVRQGTTQTS